MNATKKHGCWIQCQHCGEIYHIDENIPIDKMYVTQPCPKCDARHGLNCGSELDDLYLYANVNVDSRYYKY